MYSVCHISCNYLFRIFCRAASQLDRVIEEHPVLGGFPPAISAAAGCIALQNTGNFIKFERSNSSQISNYYSCFGCETHPRKSFLYIYSVRTRDPNLI